MSREHPPGFMVPPAEVFTIELPVKGVFNKTNRTLYASLEKAPFTSEPVFAIYEKEETITSQMLVEPSKEICVENYLGKHVDVSWTEDGERTILKLRYSEGETTQ